MNAKTQNRIIGALYSTYYLGIACIGYKILSALSYDTVWKALSNDSPLETKLLGIGAIGIAGFFAIAGTAGSINKIVDTVKGTENYLIRRALGMKQIKDHDKLIKELDEQITFLKKLNEPYKYFQN